MDDDSTKEVKKQRPNDRGYSDDFDEFGEDDEYGFKEYGYEFDKKKKEEEQKKSSSDENEDEDEIKSAKSRKKDEDYEKRLDELREVREEREEKKKQDLKNMYDKIEKRKKEKQEKEKQWRKTHGKEEEEKEKKKKSIAGEEIEQKRFFSHKKEEGVFRHKKLANLNTKGSHKIEKAFKKIHKISPEKKRNFLELIKSYNPSKTVLTKKGFDDFTRRFKSKRFVGPNFSRMKKEGIDLKSARKEFKKRDLDQLRRGITGEKDPHKYQRKSSNQGGSSPKSSSSGITAKMR